MKWWREEQCRRVTRERKLLLRGKWENAISGQQMDNVRKEIHAVSAMSQRLATDARLIKQKDDRRLPQQIRRPRLTERERYPQKVQATEENALREM